MSTFKRVTFTLRGLTPMILHNGQTADPLNSFSKRLKRISSKRTKTDDDHLAMSDIEYDASVYVSDRFPGTGLYMPSENLFSSFIKASKKLKLGPYISAAMIEDPVGYQIKTKYRSFKEMKDDPATWFKKIVSVQTSKVVRTRVILTEWSIDVGVELDHSMLMPDQFKEILFICGKAVGLGDWRPGSPKSPGFYGRFQVENYEVSDAQEF